MVFHVLEQWPRRIFGVGSAITLAGLAIGTGVFTGDTSDQVQHNGPPPFAGINLATGGFAPERLPGRYGFEYVYPDRATAKPFLDVGMTAVRVPVIWERLQPQTGSALATEEMARLDTSLRDMNEFRTIILDIHNYGDLRGKKLTASPDGIRAFADLWTKLALHYKNQPKVAFGLMNEPNGIPAAAWRTAADAAIAAIRATGARNMVLVPGSDWTGSRNWVSGADSNAAAFRGFRDPGNNFAFEMHLYLDGNSSGTSPDCVSDTVGVERLRDATGWLRANHYHGYIGEFGTGPSETCLAGLNRMLDYVTANRDVWAGWTYWTGGAWWGDYFMSAQPGPDGKPKPQLQVLAKHVAARGNGKR